MNPMSMMIGLNPVQLANMFAGDAELSRRRAAAIDRDCSDLADLLARDPVGQGALRWAQFIGREIEIIAILSMLRVLRGNSSGPRRPPAIFVK